MKYIIIIAVSFIAGKTFAQQGYLDKTFGINGLVGNDSGFCDVIALQDDGKILAGGSGNGGYTLYRYLSNGELDKSFSEDGIAEIGYNMDTTPPLIGEIRGIVITSGNQILLVASAARQTLLARFSANGILDSAFGENGLIFLQSSDDTSQSPSATVLQRDGKIVIAGAVAYDPPYYSYSPVIIRLMPDGSYDKSFGNNGRSVFYGNDAQVAHCVALQKDGKIIIGGYAGLSNTHFFTARCNPDGSLDTSFGENGVVITKIDNEFNSEEVFSILVQKDGKILSGGSVLNGFNKQNKKMTIVRYLDNGEIDKSFGDSGFARIQFDKNGSYLYTAALQNDEKIIAAGATLLNTDTSISRFAICRLSRDGIVDSSFGINGKQTNGFEYEQAAYSSAIQRNGDIVLGGYYYDGITISGLLLARYNGTPTHLLLTKIKQWIQHHTLHFQNPGEDANTAYYIIEKSNNQLSGFTSVEKINAGQKEYNFALTSTAPNYNTGKQSQPFYRIKVVNKDNSFAYTQPISSTDDNTSTINISPNPANSVLNISGLNSNVHYQISVINKDGKPVLNNIKCQPAANSYSLNISSLEAGIYFIRINDENGVVGNLKFVKN